MSDVVLVLLPPSEGKTPPARGPVLNPVELSFPSLSEQRVIVRDALATLCSGPATKARDILGISARMDTEIQRNASMSTQPCAPAVEIYTGVLYDALNWNSLTATARKRGQAHLAIASALFGLVRPLDLIPAYRLSGDTRLPPLGRLSTVWKCPVADVIAHAAGNGIIIDLRSSAYIALGPIPAELAHRTVVARVLQEKGGKRVVVSHHNKSTKGHVVRHLLSVAAPKSVPNAAGILGAAGLRVEMTPPVHDNSPWTLDILT